MKIVCVIPAWNEAKKIAAVIAAVQPLVDAVVVVDDTSPDDTSTVAAAAGAVVLRHPINRGQGAALRTGTRWALDQGADIIIHFDGDGQFLASDLPGLIEPLLQGAADIVFGSRFLRPNDQLPWLKRYLIMPAAHLTNRLFYHKSLSDPQSGLRAMTAAAAVRLDWQEDRMAHCTEILGLACKLKLKIKEVPMTVVYKNFGQKFSEGFVIIGDLFINKISN